MGSVPPGAAHKDEHIIITHVTGPAQSKTGKADAVTSPSQPWIIPWSTVEVGEKIVFQPHDAKTELKGTVTKIREDRNDGKLKVTLQCGRVSVTVSEGKGVLMKPTQEKARSENPHHEKAVGFEL